MLNTSQILYFMPNKSKIISVPALHLSISYYFITQCYIQLCCMLYVVCMLTLGYYIQSKLRKRKKNHKTNCDVTTVTCNRNNVDTVITLTWTIWISYDHTIFLRRHLYSKSPCWWAILKRNKINQKKKIKIIQWLPDFTHHTLELSTYFHTV